MRDELFDHLKHKLAETEVPDPDNGWQLMTALLDSSVRPQRIVHLRRWYTAAACLIFIGATWAMIHEFRANRATTPSKVGSAVRPAGGANANAVGATVAGGDATAGNNAQSAPATVNRDAATRPGEDAAIDSHGSAQGISRGAAHGEVDGAAHGEVDGTTTGNVNVVAHCDVDKATTGDIDGAAHGHVRHSAAGDIHGTTPGDIHGTAAGDTRLTASAEEREGAPGISVSGSQTLGDMATSTPDLKDPLQREHPRVAALRSLAPTVGPIRPARHSRWGVDVGIGANLPGSLRTITIDNRARWEPGLYPVVMARYRLNPKLSMKLGVAGPSPVTYSKTLLSKSITIDSAVTGYGSSAVSTSSTKIGRLLYLDVPVSIQYAVVPHLSLEMGIQYSHLLSEQDDTRTKATPLTNFALYYTPTLAVVNDQQPQVRQSDIRYLVGANYTWHRFSASVQYQRGLQYSATQMDDQGNTINNRSSIAKMQIMYTLW